MEQWEEEDVVMDSVVEEGRREGLASVRRRWREGASSGAVSLKRGGLWEEKTYRERSEDGGLPEQKRSLEREE